MNNSLAPHVLLDHPVGGVAGLDHSVAIVIEMIRAVPVAADGDRFFDASAEAVVGRKKRLLELSWGFLVFGFWFER